MNEVVVWLNEKDAHKYPFPYQLGDRVKSPPDGIEGIVTNAKYTGTEEGGAFSITYHIQADNGKMFEIPLAELDKIKED